MNKRLSLVFLLLIFLISLDGFFFLLFFPQDFSNQTIIQENISEAENKSEVREFFLVKKIFDGDTFEIEDGEIVRMLCIDAPEKGEEFYNESTLFLSNKILNKSVRLLKDTSNRDIYGRLLRYVFLDEEFLNSLVVEKGLARAYYYTPDTSMFQTIKNAEKIAKSKELGIWEIAEVAEINNTPTTNFSNSTSPDCLTNKYNCADFSSQSEAQKIYDSCGGVSNDIHKLDRDKDGTACESLVI